MFQALRYRFAVWCCAPLANEIEQLRTKVSGLHVDLHITKQFCEALATDLGNACAALDRLREAQAEDRPRVRVARNFAAFAEAASLARRKGN